MNKKYIPMLLIPAIFSLSGCKTTEQNYRTAYETARQHQIERAGGELPEGVELKNTGAPVVKQVSVDGVDMPAATAWVLTNDKNVTPLDSVGKYTVVVAQFKQVFNASQMRQRLAAGHYVAPVLLKISNGDYLVGAYTTDSATQALESLKAVEADSTISLKKPYPYIFRVGQKIR